MPHASARRDAPSVRLDRGADHERPLDELCAVIGLEIHIHLSTRTKMYCRCPSEADVPPNTRVCPVCLGLPGALPVLNEAAVDQALKLALALGCTLSERSGFARKSYLYPDLPKGFQITQHAAPLALSGSVPYLTREGHEACISLERLHIEEDAARMIHQPERHRTLLDYNRAGAPLAELVTRPDLRRPCDAAAVLRQVRSLVRWLAVSDGSMEQGSLRCDANISVRAPEATDLAAESPPSARVEIKNLNSFRHLERALHFEIWRHHQVLAAGGRVEPETRLWDEARACTRLMRRKEPSPDYRYHREPDLGSVVVNPSSVRRARGAAIDLPWTRRERLRQTWGLGHRETTALTADRRLADYFEATVRLYPECPAATARWVLTELPRLVEPGSEHAIEPARLAGLVELEHRGRVGAAAARRVLAIMARHRGSAEEIMRAEHLDAIGHGDELRRLALEVLDESPDLVQRYRGGEQRLLTHLMGQLMQRSQDRALPREARATLVDLLEEGS